MTLPGSEGTLVAALLLWVTVKKISVCLDEPVNTDALAVVTAALATPASRANVLRFTLATAAPTSPTLAAITS